jgi:phospholipase/carboxylesterase
LAESKPEMTMKHFIPLFILLITSILPAFSQSNLNQDLSLKYLVQLPKGNAEGAPVIILLHGYGADEKDLFELRNTFPSNYLIVSARAPYDVKGGSGYEWFNDAIVNGQHNANGAQIENSRVTILKFITEITNKYKANPDLVYLIGFSQGAMMSYEAGLTAPAKVMGIAVLSGRLFATLRPLIRLTPELAQMKIFVAHGTADTRIPISEAEDGINYLKLKGLNPEFHTYPGMAHEIGKEELNDLLKWLGKG